MIIYGGIFDVCKELNDMHIFDMKKEQWICLFEELNSPLKNNASMDSQRKRSPTIKKEKLALTDTVQKEIRSPMKNKT
jgi:hypothetical protein